MRYLNRAIFIFCLLPAALNAQVVFPSDTAEVFRRHTLARLGGSSSDIITAISAGATGEIYVAGNTTSSDFPVKNAAQPASPEAPAMRSADGVHTLTPFSLPPVGTDLQFPDSLFLRAHPSIPGLLFAAAGATLSRSSDAGQTWHTAYVARGREDLAGFIVAVGFDKLAPSIVYLSSTDGFSVSEDSGSNWQTRAGRPGGYISSPGPLSFGEPRIESDARGTGALISYSGRMAQLSRDGGNTWTTLRPPTGQTSSVATFSRTREGRIYAGVAAGAAGSLWVSDDWGQTWTASKAQPGRAVVDLFSDPEVANRLYVVTLGSLLVTENDAESWVQTTNSSSLGYQVSQATGCDSGTLLVTTQARDELSFSSDRGQTWQATPLSDVEKFTAGAACSVYAVKNVSGDGFVARLDRTGAIEWSTYLADIGLEAVTALSTDKAGNVLLAGTVGTMSDILLAKYTSGGRLLWKKTLGGTSWDTPFDIAADGAGNIVIAGRTSSDNFPVTAGAARTEPGSGFAAKLNPSGEIIWATYLETAAQSLAVEPVDSVLVAGSERLLRIDASGTSMDMVSTVVPRPRIVRTDASGNVFLAGTVMSDETPATPGAYVSPVRAQICNAISWSAPFFFPQADLQIARLKARTLEPVFSALLGGECGSRPDALVVAPDGRVTVGFVSQSQAFDLRAPVASAGFCQPYDLATGVAQLSPDGSQLLRSTMLDGCSAIAAAGTDSAIYAASDNAEGVVLQVDSAIAAGPRLDSVSNAFSGTGFGVSPGELVSLRGAALGPADAIDLGINPQNDLPAELGGTQVLFNGTRVPLLRVSEEQVIFVAPFRIGGRSATIQVQRNGQHSNDVLAPVVASNPALLAAGFPFTEPETTPLANARNSDGTLNGPSNPAKVGSTVWVFATGLGTTNFEVESGRVATTETLQPAALFREAADVPFSYSLYPTAPDPSGIRAMPAFLNSIFAIPITARESPDQPGWQLIRITSAQHLRGTSRRSFSPTVSIYVCNPDATGNCAAR